MDAKKCIQFLKMPFLHPETGEQLDIDSPQYAKLNKECYKFIHFDILEQTDITKFKYPKNNKALSFQSIEYFMNHTDKLVCSNSSKPSVSDVCFTINKGILKAPLNFKSIIESCTKRFVLIMLIIESDTANLLLYDKQKYEWERFIPFGATQISQKLSQNIDNLLIDYFEHCGLPLKNYYQPYIGCPINDSTITKLNISAEQQGIYCSIWGIWFIYLKLQYPEMWREHLIYIALQELSTHTDQFNNFIKDYLLFLIGEP